MPCYYPLKAFKTASGDVVFNELRRHGDIVSELELPCGRCIGCRLERARQWSIRCMHEAQLHDDNCFLTLTYDEEHLPFDGSLNYDHFQKFMKRLRKFYKGKRIRFYMCGEYGELNRRPHYHAILFGIDFSDKKLIGSGSQKHRLYQSETLDRLWGFGLCSIGAVSFDSAGYVARYCLKKVTGDQSEEYYKNVCRVTGSIYDIVPEFSHMSLKPGIGSGWFERFGSDVYPHDYCVVNGKQVKPPKFYDRKYGKVAPDSADQVLADRQFDGYQKRDDSTPDRLRVRERVVKGRLSLTKRSF